MAYKWDPKWPRRKVFLGGGGECCSKSEEEEDGDEKEDYGDHFAAWNFLERERKKDGS